MKDAQGGGEERAGETIVQLGERLAVATAHAAHELGIEAGALGGGLDLGSAVGRIHAGNSVHPSRRRGKVTGPA